MDESTGELQPREKLLKYGASALNDEELLALFLRTGMPGIPVMDLARQLLAHFGSLWQLMSADIQAFKEIKGVGIAKYAQIHAVAELARRYFSSTMAEGHALLSPQITHDFIRSQLTHQPREIFMVIFLDNQHRVVHWSHLFSGTIASVEVHPREIIREALKVNAAALILAHNHPSGNAEPSLADRHITDKIIQTALLMELRVLDHLVIGHGEYVSFAERGWI